MEQKLSEREWLLVLPKADTDPDYDGENEDHSKIAIFTGDRIGSPGYFSVGNEILFDENVYPGENKVAEENAKSIFKAIKAHDALVEALQEVLSVIDAGRDFDCNEHNKAILVNALKIAKGE